MPHRRPDLVFASMVGVLLVTGCADSDRPGDWIGEVVDQPAPAREGSRYPHLAGLAGGPTVMSWLQSAGADETELRFATWHGGGWSDPTVVAKGSNWFVNWADFPSVVPVSPEHWGAHWLQQRPGGVYAYDVRVVSSVDGGASWTAPISPHDDGTPTEHGFVTLLGTGGQLRAVWLDGRHTSGEHEHEGTSGGAMTLRSAVIGRDGSQGGPDVELDGRVCDCCQTDAARTDDGWVVVYRDRSPDELRDIAVVRLDSSGWSAPAHVHDDGWRIDACPVNGPAIDARGRNLVVAWFTAADRPRVRIAFSGDGGRTFTAPVEVDAGRVAGRVDAVLLEDGRAVVSWLADGETGAEIRVQPYTPQGPAGAVEIVARSSVARSSGFPQMVLAGDGLLFAWTESGDPARVRTAFARLR